jgi:hypothetical protein
MIERLDPLPEHARGVVAGSSQQVREPLLSTGFPSRAGRAAKLR